MSDTRFHLRQVDTEAGPLALVTIDNGADHTKPTVFGRSAFESAQRVLSELEDGDWVAMVLTGKPFVFAVGADMTEFPKISSRQEAIEGSRAGHDAFGRIAALPFPTVAAINGACLGGGLEIALHCDARTISSAVRHFGVPEVFLGIFPAWGGTQLIPRLVGPEDGREGRRAEPDAPEQDAESRRGRRGGPRRQAARAGRVPRRVDRVRAGARGEATRANAARHHRLRGRPQARTQSARRLRARRSPCALPRARSDRGLADLEHRGGLPSRGGGDRGPDALAAGARLAVRVRPRRAAGEAGHRPARRRGAQGEEGRDRRRRADGDATRERSSCSDWRCRSCSATSTRRSSTARSRRSARRSPRSGRYSEGKARFLGSLVSGSTGYDGFADCDLVLEAVFEEIERQAARSSASSRASSRPSACWRRTPPRCRSRRWRRSSSTRSASPACTSSTRSPCCRSSR